MARRCQKAVKHFICPRFNGPIFGGLLFVTPAKNHGAYSAMPSTPTTSSGARRTLSAASHSLTVSFGDQLADGIASRAQSTLYAEPHPLPSPFLAVLAKVLHDTRPELLLVFDAFHIRQADPLVILLAFDLNQGELLLCKRTIDAIGAMLIVHLASGADLSKVIRG